MFTLIGLLIISAMVLLVSLFLISLGGTIFIIFGGDLIIALFIILAALAVALVSAIIGGVGFIAVFGDVLVFALVVYLIVKAFKKMNSKK